MDDDATRTHSSIARRVRGLARFAFGSLTRADDSAHGQHLALLQTESLELDLSDPAQRQFGDYELLERIGEGGMGVVYRAHHIPLDRTVAIKLLSAGPWASRDFIERFEREAQNAARMQHPNIVTVFEGGSHDGLHFFSMRLVEGQSLSTLLKRGEHFTPKAAASLMRTVAEAIAYAHSLGVLHLDLKPGNILIDGDGVPHVTDFGLARRLDSALTTDNDEVSGTPSYMAPEQTQLHVQKLTAATDIWELGAILYELLTGAPPFRAGSAEDTLKLVVQGQVRAPRRWRPNLPLDLEAIVLRCLRRDPGERYPSARALADDLGRYLDGRAVQARPLNAVQRLVRWARREPKLATSVGFAIVVLIVGLVMTSAQWRRAQHNAVLAQHSARVARHTLWDARSAAAQKLIAQGDAYPALSDALANLREMEAHGDRGDAALERLRIGTVLANAPQLIDAIPIGAGKQVLTIAFSHDGKLVAAVTGERKVHLIDVASGKQRWQVLAKPNSFGMTEFHLQRGPLEFQFSSDGQRLVGHVQPYGPASGDNPVLYPHEIDSVLIDVATGRLVAPPRQFADFMAVDYSDNGRYALLFDRHGDVQRWRTLPWRPDGDLVYLAGDIAPSHDGRQLQQLQDEALLTDDGKTMVLADPSKLRLRSFDARNMQLQRTLTLTTDEDRATAWTLRHDNQQLAIGTTSGQIAMWDLGSGKVVWLHMRFDGWISRLRYSADDARLLVVANEPGEMGMFDARTLDPVAPPVMLGGAVDLANTTDVEFGPDASDVLTVLGATRAILWRVPSRGFPLSAPVPAAPPMAASGASFALSQDARSHLLATGELGVLKLWRVRWTPYVGGLAAPMVADTLRFDGRHLVSADGNRVYVFDVASGRPVGKTIALPEAPTYAGLDGSGTHLIAIAGRELSCWNWHDATPCWPALELPDSPLRLGLAAHAPIMAVSTGSNSRGMFFEHVRLIDLATGRQRGTPIALHGPLGALRFSDDGRRLLAFENADTIRADGNVVRVIDTASARIAQNLVHESRKPRHIVDARFAGDGSIWSLSTALGDGPDAYTIWHWDARGRLLAKIQGAGDFGLLPMPGGHRVIETDVATVFDDAGAPAVRLAVPASRNRVNAGALSTDGKLLALGTLDGVGVFVIDRNQRLVPDFKLALPNHDVIQQLAFASDGSRLIGRTMTGHWFEWRIVTDMRPGATIAQDLALRNFNARATPATELSAQQRESLRAADPGPTLPAQALPAPADARPAGPLPDPRYRPLDIDAIADVDPRTQMNRAERVPPHPQSWPTLPHGLQRYDGVDFLLGRAVQLSGTPLNVLNTAFPAKSSPLSIAPQRVTAVDLLVLQFQHIKGESGAVRLRYADGSEKVLPILDGRDTFSFMDIAALENPVKARIGWLGAFPAAMRWWGFADSGEAAEFSSNVVHLENPEPDKTVVGISLEAPPTASPGLLFLAVTLEPVAPDQRGTR